MAYTLYVQKGGAWHPVTGGAASGGGGLFSGQISSTVPSTTSTGLTTWVNQGSTAAFANNANGLALFDQTNAGGEDWRMLVKAAPATPYTLTTLMMMAPLGADFTAGGLLFRDSATGKFQVVCLSYRTGWFLSLVNYTNEITFSAFVTTTLYPNPTGPGGVLVGGMMAWLRIADDGTNVSFSVSGDGVVFQVWYTVAKTSGFLGSSGYNQIGIGVDPNGAGAAMTMLSYLQS